MKVYRVTFKNGRPVGMIVEHGKVTVAHPTIGKVEGKNIKDVKKLIESKKGEIFRLR